jgi:hypothetical protein
MINQFLATTDAVSQSFLHFRPLGTYPINYDHPRFLGPAFRPPYSIPLDHCLHQLAHNRRRPPRFPEPVCLGRRCLPPHTDRMPACLRQTRRYFRS